jgi:hypothetical protein
MGSMIDEENGEGECDISMRMLWRCRVIVLSCVRRYFSLNLFRGHCVDDEADADTMEMSMETR